MIYIINIFSVQSVLTPLSLPLIKWNIHKEAKLSNLIYI